MFAIIKTGGKQYKVQKGDEIFIEKLPQTDGESVTFNEVLMIDSKIGAPFLSGASVKGKIVKQGKQKKLKIIRYHAKTNIQKINGHRQPYTKVLIEEITG